ncbi:MFS transporter [Streptomyces tropicalis]|uniref:MFS transporter n=1 Tax=Streptomyces tropicalis TaxID=3034234 RepID=A0ABT6AB30_9ACTN|nr:MFS transporter [Streptomyces tropicalis]MDF3301859.1 MFS transporter [Streptomyces tropicalis]
MTGRTLGRPFGWLWAAYGISTFGTWLAFDAFAMTAVLVLHAGAAQVSVLAAAGLAVGALVAVPFGPWVEFRGKRPVMMAADLVRCAAMATVPVAYVCGRLVFAHLLVVSVIVAAADIAFGAASGAFLKRLVPPEGLLVANGRFESTTWTATMLGPPAGGALAGAFGPVVTVAVDAVSYLLSAAGIRAIGRTAADDAAHPGRRTPRAGERREEEGEGEGEKGERRADGPHHERPTAPAAAAAPGTPAVAAAPGTPAVAAAPGRAAGLLDGWRFVLADPSLRPLFFNTLLVNGLIMASSPLLAVLMLGPLGFAPWQYGLAFAVPCAGGLAGSRLARPLVARFGQRRVLLTTGALRACWSVALALVRPGTAGLVLVMVAELGLIACSGIYSPVLATHRLERTAPERVARTLAAWSVSSKATTAALTAAWGALAQFTGTRTAIGLAGLLLLATPLLLPWRTRTPRPEPLPAAAEV